MWYGNSGNESSTYRIDGTYTHYIRRKEPSFWFNASIFNFCTCILLNAIYGQVLCEIEGEHNNNGSEATKRNETKQKTTTTTEKDIEKDKLPSLFHLSSIHLKRGKTHHFCIHNFCVSFCLCEFVAIAVLLMCSRALVRSFVWQNCFPWL